MVAEPWGLPAQQASPLLHGVDDDDEDPLGTLLGSRPSGADDDFASDLAKSFEAYFDTKDTPGKDDMPDQRGVDEWKKHLESIFSSPPAASTTQLPPTPPVSHASPVSLGGTRLSSPLMGMGGLLKYGLSLPGMPSTPLSNELLRASGLSPDASAFSSPLMYQPARRVHSYGGTTGGIPLSPCSLGGLEGARPGMGYGMHSEWGEMAGGEPAPPRRPRMEVTRERPCAHNQWERISKKKNSISLRCRLCKACWKTKLEFFQKCTAFYAGQCTKGDRCAHPHIYSKAAEKHQMRRQADDDGEDDEDPRTRGPSGDRSEASIVTVVPVERSEVSVVASETSAAQDEWHDAPPGV
eukprot:TRINITY_DN1100_c0_g2_i1.p1 TRINITY_DN1100_c0_g2~~TRINITY_DN1100_c0_g2_i1.p1  ORF type:complete len:352 (+),score=83.53 TRINITY_DN1100_c0_g2_i1:106-1161(+)